MSVTPGDELFERNRAVFSHRFPKAWALLEQLRPTSRPVFAEGRLVNLDLGKTTFYAADAREAAAEQVAGYFADPDRLGFSDPAHCNLSPVSKALLEEIKAYFGRNLGGQMESLPLVDVGFAFVFGVGLGYHLQDVVARTGCRQVILIEPIPELLLHSLRAIDWADLLDRADAAGQELHLLFEQDPERIIQIVQGLLFEKGSTFLDGSHAFVHYRSWALLKARALLNERIKVYYVSSGFFEDEFLMMTNTFRNLRQNPFRLIERRPHLRQDMPVFVVGSGPSLDAALPYLKRWREHAIVFSCGTALGILLKNGIRPDLHLENENTYPLVNNLRAWDAEFGLKGIILVGSTSIPPECAPYFERSWFYFREYLSSTYLMAAGHEPLPGVGPLVANAAYAAIATLGLRNIYLFGVDCGRKIDGAHHARDAVYMEDGYDNWAPGEGLDWIENSFSRQVPGNFGGTVETAWNLDMSRVAFTVSQRRLQANLINCSDGARIEGAQPKAPAGLSFTGPAGGQAAVIARIEAQLASFEAGRFLEATDFSAYAGQCAGFPDLIAPVIDDVKAGEPSYWALENRLRRFRVEAADAVRGPWSMMYSSANSMIRLGAFAGTRIAGEADRRRFFDFFLERYQAALIAMAERAGALFEGMARGEAPPYRTFEDVGGPT